MKERIVLLLPLVAAFIFFAFEKTAEIKRVEASKKRILSEIKPQTVRAAAFGVSEKVGDFAPAKPGENQSNEKTADEKARQVPNNLPFRKQLKSAARDTEKNLAQISTETMPAPALSFDGLSSNDNAAAYGFRMVPPDPFGDVGPNHYVQAVNALIRVYDKNGNALTPPFKPANLFAPLGTPCSSRNDGDPIILYDPLADRWLISQFCTQFPPFRQMFAVSATGDPTGKYYIYEFAMPNFKLNDYSKIGVWSDGYYMTTDQFLGGDYSGTGVFAFDKAKMLAGDAAAGYIYFDLASPSTIRLGGLLPADLDGIKPPPIGAPNVFVGYAATEYGDASDAIRLFDFHADFRDPANSSFTERDESPLATAPFDPTSSDGRNDISQFAPGEPLDSQSDRLMYRAAYRNFGTHESLVFNQTVRTSPSGGGYHAGVRVYELRKSNGAFKIREQATVGNDSESRWMASAAQDHQGNIALGYSLGNAEKKPSIFYSGKLATDPVGTFRREAALVSGTGVQNSGGSRWGDYSAMSIDPSDDCTFWMTNQYYAAENPLGWLTRIGKFKFAECSPAPRSTITGVVSNASNSQPIENALVTANHVFSRSTNSNGNFGNFLISPDTYVLTVSAKGFRSQTQTVSVTNGQTMIQNFALEPTAVLENSGTELIAESCAVNDSAEPGETVTINIALRNTGARNTANLTAELQPTGGVVNPSKSQNYGALPTGGNSVLRPFTFTASPDSDCGEPILLNFELRDGGENLGTISITLNTGTKRIALQENFDSVFAPNLPVGWTTGTTGAQQNWTTATAQRHSAPNSVFSSNPNQVGINELVSPVFQIVSQNAEISFRNWYELESTFLRNKFYDGSVLEIKIGNNDWQDIEAAGGAFTSGAYDGVLDGCCQNPLAGRRAWSGKSGVNQNSEFVTSTAKLPASANGNDVRLRWRTGTDVGSSRQGQYIDDLIVSDGYVCNCRSAQKNRAPFDFDGDGKTDLSVFRPTDDASKPDFLIQNSSNSSLRNDAWGSAGDIAVNSDYDGDGKTDFAVFRLSTRTWFILNSSNLSITTINFGLADDKLTPADFDGDGKSDIAVFRPSTGTWYRLNSSNKQLFIHQFGTNGDTPVQADYDGDDKADLAVFRPSDGIWYVLRSADNGFSATRFGLNGDKPIVGDYDGDDKADFAVFRPSDKNWYLLQSSQGFKAVRFGLSDDKVLQGDFDGDKRNDIAVFRPANNGWYYLKSSNGDVAVKSFGEKGDTPLPSIFVNH